MENADLTGYASIDKPWLKYYPEGAENRPLPQKTLFQAVYEANKDHQSDYAFNYFGKRITYREFFHKIDTVSRSLTRIGVKPNDIVTIKGLSAPETFYVAYACSKIGAIINRISVLAGEQELRELCAAELPEYSVPDKYVFRDAMPLTAVGKIDFRALEEMENRK